MAKYEYEYPHPAVATDCVVFGFDGRDLKVLLIQRGIEPYKGILAFPGGFMRMDETAEECAIRELKEETGLELTNIKQLGAFSGVHRDPRERIVSIAFYALARQSEVHGGDDAAHAHWWAINEIPQLAFDHDYILRQAMNRIRQDIHFEPVGFGLLEEYFTIADLQRLYECILGVHFDRRNFYRKMLQTGILQEVDETAVEQKAQIETRIERVKRLHDLLHNTPEKESKPAEPQYYGKNKEMKDRSIDDLFGGSREPDKPMLSISPEPAMDFSLKAPDLQIDVDIDSAPASLDRPHAVGRKGKLFRFDKESYDRWKDGGNFRLEF